MVLPDRIDILEELTIDDIIPQHGVHIEPGRISINL